MKLFVSTAMIGAALFAAPLAHANEDPAANPPNCSAADLEGVRAGVQASTSAYLFSHPDVNDFFNSLEGMPKGQTHAKVEAYMTSTRRRRRIWPASVSRSSISRTGAASRRRPSSTLYAQHTSARPSEARTRQIAQRYGRSLRTHRNWVSWVNR